MAGKHFKESAPEEPQDQPYGAPAGTGAAGRHMRSAQGAGSTPDEQGASDDSAWRYDPALDQGAAPSDWDRTLVDDQMWTAPSPIPPSAGYAVPPIPESDGLVRKRRKKRRSKAPFIVLGLFLVLLAAAGGFAYTAYTSVKSVYAEAKEVLALVEDLPSQLTDDDADLDASVEEITTIVASMKEEMSSDLWDLFALVPTYGEDVVAARELVDIVDVLCTDALVPIAESLSGTSLTGLVADGGVIDVEAVTALVEAVGGSYDVLSEANDRAQAIGETHIEKLTSYVEKAQSALETIDALAEAAEPLLDVLPSLLGAEDGTRTYLIIAQNNAEIRATGGFGGAQGIITITDGVIEMGDFEACNKTSNRSIISLTSEEYTLFQTRSVTMNYTSGDANFTPDFPRACELYMTIWEYNHPDDEIDGVIAIDPVFLQWLIAATGGSVTAEDGTVVDGTNAAEVLMSEVYWMYDDNDDQDAVFASVAAGAFHLLLDNLSSIDLSALFETIQLGMEEGRVLAYMVDEEEQELIEYLNIDGALPTEVEDLQTGIYVNNHSYSKLDWYLDLDVWMGEGTENEDGSVSYEFTVVLENTLTDEEAASLPSYVQASSIWAYDDAEIILDFYLYAPYGGSISDVTCTYTTLKESTHNDLQVYFGELRMMPGESITVTYTVTVPAEVADQELWVRVTPTADVSLDEDDTDAIA